MFFVNKFEELLYLSQKPIETAKKKYLFFLAKSKIFAFWLKREKFLFMVGKFAWISHFLIISQKMVKIEIEIFFINLMEVWGKLIMQKKLFNLLIQVRAWHIKFIDFFLFYSRSPRTTRKTRKKVNDWILNHRNLKKYTIEICRGKKGDTGDPGTPVSKTFRFNKIELMKFA